MLIRIFLQGRSISQKLILSLLTVLAMLIALLIHDFAQALVAYIFGDKTAKIQGRLSLNPMKYLEPFGTAALLLFGIGWAKPSDIRAERFRRPRLGCALTSLTGPVANLFFGVLFTFPWLLCGIALQDKSTAAVTYTGYFFELLAIYCFSLGFFELLPIPSLDGARALGQILPRKIRVAFEGFERYGLIVAGAAVLVFHYTGLADSLLGFALDASARIWLPILG